MSSLISYIHLCPPKSPNISRDAPCTSLAIGCCKYSLNYGICKIYWFVWKGFQDVFSFSIPNYGWPFELTDIFGLGWNRQLAIVTVGLSKTTFTSAPRSNLQALRARPVSRGASGATVAPRAATASAADRMAGAGVEVRWGHRGSRWAPKLG